MILLGQDGNIHKKSRNKSSSNQNENRQTWWSPRIVALILFPYLLFIILGVLIPKEGGDIGKFVASGDWTLAGGLNLLFVAVLQCLSYPFHDPVMTDRGFIADPKTTLKSFFWATWIGGVCILLFSFVGIYGQFQERGVRRKCIFKWIWTEFWNCSFVLLLTICLIETLLFWDSLCRFLKRTRKMQSIVYCICVTWWNCE